MEPIEKRIADGSKPALNIKNMSGLIAECKAMIASGRRVAAVKKYRAKTGASLQEAKRALDDNDKRPLKPEDIPAIKWHIVMERYFLREDGAIVCKGVSVELGWLDGKGGVHWTKCN